VLLAAVVLVAAVLPLGARGAANRWHDDTLWANSLRSLGGLAVPFDFAVFLQAAEDVRSGESPYIDPEQLSEGASAPYVYPPFLAIVLVPVTALPDGIAGSSPAGVLASLFLVACVIGTLLLLGVRDWRCYPVALLYPVTLENIEYGSLGPLLALLVALAWRYRDRAGPAAAATGVAVVLKLFLWPLVFWLAATRRWRTALLSVAAALGLALASWAAIGFSGIADYPTLLRKLSDLEAENSYSALALLRSVGLGAALAQLLVLLTGAVLLALAWRSARSDGSTATERDRRSLTLSLIAGLVLTPILWLHYLVLLVVPIGLARPRLSALWFAPLALTLFEALDWYRGWPRGDLAALLSVAALVALVTLGSRTAPQPAAGHASG
jgi:alpha-1,2-mannosyltransferase